jgi:hypothetical protein
MADLFGNGCGGFHIQEHEDSFFLLRLVIFSNKKIMQYSLAKIVAYFSIKKTNANDGCNIDLDTPEGKAGKKYPYIFPNLAIKYALVDFGGIINNCIHQQEKNIDKNIDQGFEYDLFGEASVNKEPGEI